MQTTKNTKSKQIGPIVAKVFFTLLLAANIIFIFYNSSKIGTVSSGVSLRAMDILNNMLNRLGFGFTLTHTLVRKLGHLAEYMMLGFTFTLTLRVYTRRLLAHISWPLLAGLFIAVCDEFYQSFVPGRTSSVRDVLIDFAGIWCGLLAAAFVILLCGAVSRAIRPIKNGETDIS